MTKVRKFAIPFIAGFFSGENIISKTVTICLMLTFGRLAMWRIKEAHHSDLPNLPNKKPNLN